ncbi:leucine-rich repeat-containing protein 17-like [Saccostrea cucullata]|uniref:leucine-rich repeat-containing protein 17-like n=1 Tax=Saccostrea cuccullata TaxID=36930 RepID=UPI002ED60D13
MLGLIDPLYVVLRPIQWFFTHIKTSPYTDEGLQILTFTQHSVRELNRARKYCDTGLRSVKSPMKDPHFLLQSEERTNFSRPRSLSGTGISRIEKESFSNLTYLQRLSLVNNDLAFIDQKTFSGLRNLRFLEVRQNPFHCDCLLEGFVQFIQKFQLNNSMDTPKCATPIKRKGMRLKDISPTVLSCEKSSMTGSIYYLLRQIHGSA